MLLNILHAATTPLKCQLFTTKQVQVSVLRLDTIHPVISGNKLFKLHYFLEAAAAAPHRSLLTFGGAYSNHLVAAAYACQLAGIRCIGVVRGEQAPQLSHTLQQCIQYGMILKFVSRERYAQKDDPDFFESLQMEFGPCTIVPEGGYQADGARGAALIHQLVPAGTYSHIGMAAGTATTAAGILMGATTEKIICIPVLKGMTDIAQRIAFCSNNKANMQQLEVFNDYHFGGYAKKTAALIDFMNDTWTAHALPTDFVYTAKLFYGITDKIKEGYFAAGSNILCLHTGGLQGNLSLPPGSLLF